MSRYLAELSRDRISRYVFYMQLWNPKNKSFGEEVSVLIDTGCFNTTVDWELARIYGTVFKETMKIKLGGTTENAHICLMHKMKVNDFVMENVLALAFPFKGELHRHILLGTNVLNNWDFQISRKRDELCFNEDFPTNLPNGEAPYRTYFDNHGQAVYFQNGENKPGY